MDVDYYPFGLTMAGISSKAAGKLENKKRFNGIEHTTDLDLNQYDAFYRTMDPQIGRWWQIDPKVDEGYESVSPYTSMYNNPISISDPLGDEGEDANQSNISTEEQSGGDGCCEFLRQALISAGSTLNGALNTVTYGLWPAKGFVNTDHYSEQDKATQESAARIGQIGMMLPMFRLGPRSASPELVPISIKLLKPGNPAIPVLPPVARAFPIPAPAQVVNAHGQKKQSTGSTRKSGDSHMRQYKNNKKGNKENPNKKKGADERRTKNKPKD
jgi:RHS repeat-associated protein